LRKNHSGMETLSSKASLSVLPSWLRKNHSGMETYEIAEGTGGGIGVA